MQGLRYDTRMQHQAPDPDFDARVRNNFALQGLMTTLGAKILSVQPGAVEIALLPRPDFSQQNGFVHAGAIASILDSACGYSAVSLMPADVDALTVEFKINLLRPAIGTRMIARGHVVKSGQTLSVCQGECFAETESGEKLIATMQNTIMTIRGR